MASSKPGNDIPLFPLSNVLLPGGELQLRIFDWAEERVIEVPGELALLPTIRERLIDQMAPHYRDAPRELYDDASWVGFRLTELLPLAPDEAQHMLELTDPARRLAELRDILPRFQRD